jgi:D-glycero-D-manno-heptose 1,7-bisphosphate phosphatase
MGSHESPVVKYEEGIMTQPAVFLDRDGTINEQMGYINHISRFVLLPGIGEAIRQLNQNGFLVIIVSNQSGVARGYFPVDLVYQVHDRMREELRKQGAHIDGIFFCPHHPRGVVREYACECTCRKPGTGMIEQALKEFPVDVKRSYVVGDKYSDLEMGRRCGIPSILVETGYGKGEAAYIMPRKAWPPDSIAADLLEAVHWILEREKSR